MRGLPKAAVLAATIMLSSFAVPPSTQAGGTTPADHTPAPSSADDGIGKHWSKPRSADLQFELNENDEIAALEAIRVALTEVADGSSYVWHRWHGRLSGIVQPTSSFKDPSGRVCRHLVVAMVSTVRTARVEGIACRMPDGRWELEG